MINRALLIKELRENRVKFWLCFVLLAALAAAVPLLFDFSRDFLRNLDLAPFIDPRDLEFILSSYDNYLWSQWSAKNLTQFATVAAVVLAAGSLAGEVAYGTAPFLASKPVTSRGVFYTKAAAGLLMLALCVFGSSAMLGALSVWKGFLPDWGRLLAAVSITYLGAAVIYLGTAAFSALIGEPVRAGVAAALFWIMASLPGYFRATASFSIFFQMKGIAYWFRGESPLVPAALFLAFGALLLEAGVYLWGRRQF